MRIILCDDDNQVLTQLQKYLREYHRSAHLPQPEYTVYSRGDALLASESRASAPRAEIAFLNVEIPGRNGITSKINHRNSQRNVIEW